MFPWEVIAKATDGNRKAVAERLGHSRSWLDKTCLMPEAGGEKSSVERTAELILAVHAEGGIGAAQIILDYLLSEGGCLPSVALPADGAALDLVSLGTATITFGRVCQEIGNAFANDGRIDEIEADRAITAMEGHLSAVCRELAVLRRQRASADVATARRRLGPHRVPRLLVLRQATA